jgi:hypothetical protein
VLITTRDKAVQKPPLFVHSLLNCCSLNSTTGWFASFSRG